METIFNFFKNNYEWIFGGIGVAAIAAIVKFFWNKPSNNNLIKQKQRSGDNSTSIQIGQINQEKNERQN